MRFYLKLLAAIAIFVCGLGLPARQTIADLAFDLRVAYVCRGGDAGEFEKLVDGTQRTLAAQRGETECYEFGKRYEQLVAQRMAQAREANLCISDQLRQAIKDDCAREVFSTTRWARESEQARRPEVAALALHAHDTVAQLD